MSTKYLGKHFDIHGGGMDLKFPHHEDEIAQSCGSFGCNPAKYWMHANMLNVNGQKMSKSFGNYFLPKEIIEGTTTLFKKAYPANVLRFFMMQAHYRSTLDFTETALDAAEKGFSRLTDGLNLIEKLTVSETSSIDVNSIVASFYTAMNDDFNAPILIASLFDAVRQINLINDGNGTISQSDKELLESEMKNFIFDVLGLEIASTNNDSKLNPVMDLVLDLRQQARANKDWTTSDKIRDGLAAAGIVVKDGKKGTSWN
jgi:cysteinyl-tRNA synthetase